MYQPVLAAVVAFFGYTTLNVGQACQKIGLARCKEKPRIGWTIWAIATVATGSAVLIIFVAVSLGTASLVGAMAGTGLASLALFSRFVMKEQLGRRELAGVLLVLSGAVLVGAFAAEEPTRAYDVRALVVLQPSLLLAYGLLWFVGGKRRAPGVLIGAVSGMFSGFATLYQRLVSTTSTGFGGILTNPANLIWIGMSIAAMVILQFAHGRGKAIKIIPAHTANFVCVPIIGGMVAFGETIRVPQWAGIAFILVGVVLMTALSPRDNLAAAATGNIEARG